MIIDSKGKLFGRISIIDLLIALCVVGMLFGVFFRVLTSGGLSKTSIKTPIQVTLCSREVRQYTVASVSLGDVVFDDSGARLGKISDIKTSPSKKIYEADNGKIYYAELPNKYDLFMTIDAEGQVDKSGYFINGSRQVGSGSTHLIHTNRANMECVVFEVSKNVD